jgi:hypothetical protein
VPRSVDQSGCAKKPGGGDRTGPIVEIIEQGEDTMLMLLALLADIAGAEADRRLANMAALYEQVCLKTFPDDKAVVAAMTERHSRELSVDEVKVTMGDDPARGWELTGGGATAWIEFPPYHACSIRWNAPAIGDLQPYRKIADAYEARVGGFRPTAPYDADQGDIHVHIVGERRRLADGSSETLMFVDQSIGNAKRRDAGETGVVLRFVHQFAPPESGK